jgi:hypothetical protein
MIFFHTDPNGCMEMDIRNGSGHSEEIQVNITSSKEPPVLLGDYLVLTCLARGDSNTVYQFNWLHKDILLPDETTSTLVLPVVTRRELGVYQCTVSNNGVVVRSSSINITSQG